MTNQFNFLYCIDHKTNQNYCRTCTEKELPPHGGSLSLPVARPEGYDVFVTSQKSSAAFDLAVVTSTAAPHEK